MKTEDKAEPEETETTEAGPVTDLLVEEVNHNNL